MSELDTPRWSFGYSDGTPGTPEYEPPPLVCNWCKTVASRCQCEPTMVTDEARPLKRIGLVGSDEYRAEQSERNRRRSAAIDIARAALGEQGVG